MYKPIKTIAQWLGIETPIKLTDTDRSDFETTMKDQLFGRRIVKAQICGDQECYLYLDNGRRLRLAGNEGCGGCDNGWYYVDKIMEAIDLQDNAITNVQLVVDFDDKNYDDIYRLFVITANKKIQAASFVGSDNGYYGTGFSVYVEVQGK